MKLSARNVFKGTVTQVSKGPVNSRVLIDIGGGNIVSSVITAGATEDLELDVGEQVQVIIKSSDVIIGK